jgi:shikimate dehydrogenase
MTLKNTPLAAVIGHPIAQSKSPKLHNHWLKRYMIDGHYVPMDVAPSDFETVIRMLPKIGFVGANITIPYKLDALNLADLVTDRARLIGAANTLVFRKDGKIQADNTDGYGFIQNLFQTVPNWSPTSAKALVLGAGGAARAVLASFLEIGVPQITLTNRSQDRADALRAEFGDKIQVIDWVQAGNAMEQVNIIVNTTSLGMIGKPEMRIPLDGIQKDAVVYDLVYNPLQTKLLRAASEAGAIPVDGLGMLLHQAAPGFERWFRHKPEIDDKLRSAVLR